MSTKVYQVNINAIVLADTDPKSWGRAILTDYLTATPTLVASVTSELLIPKAKPEVEAPSVVAPGADKPASKPYLGKRPRRGRDKSGELEFRYLSYDYFLTAEHLCIGHRVISHMPGDPSKCVWLTREEAIQVNAAVMERRHAERGARRAEQAGK